MSSLKIPKEWMNKLRTLQASLWIEDKIRISFVEILKLIFKKTNWEEIKEELRKKKKK